MNLNGNHLSANAQAIEDRDVAKSPNKLNDKQAAFARRYVVHFNGAKAAIEAGYSEKRAKVQAHELMAMPHVQAEVARLTAAKSERSDIEADEIVETLAHIVRADIRDVMEWGLEEVEDDEGLPVTMPNGEALMRPFVRPVASQDLPRRLSCAVAEVSMTDKGSFKIKMHDKGAAIDKLMRHLGMFEKDNRQVADGLADLIAAAQGTTIPIATRNAPQRAEGGDE
ncbi:phage terminase small subunit [Paracoccus alcaliphilus]|uniref:Phage terminase small subunit n=1 Tax=Paracoccus alcaliphilus TaxID=34002 RepID=A0A1H8K323_9RHOB|nr:terminase small subunit [Paracoccus alcaliphilus]SEN87352.1 phage terminase small subunit [Paracoccus alcaliphilus]